MARVKELDQAIKTVKSSADLGILSAKLDMDTAPVRIYTDASFATNDDLSSQVGILILLRDDDGQCHIRENKSRKSRRVVRSIMAGEAGAFIDGFDLWFAVAADVEMLLGRKPKIYMYTGSKQLFDAMTRGKHTSERLLVDILAARQSYRRFEMEGVALVCGEANPAYDLSKLNGGALRKLMLLSTDNTPVDQWIERSSLPQSAADESGPQC